jgi:drug/metabolite transporter (DMT)-like permease
MDRPSEALADDVPDVTSLGGVMGATHAEGDQPSLTLSDTPLIEDSEGRARAPSAGIEVMVSFIEEEATSPESEAEAAATYRSNLLLGIGICLVSAFCFSITVFLVKAASNEGVNSFQIVWIRSATQGVFALGWLIPHKHRIFGKTKRENALLSVRGICGSLGMICYYYGITVVRWSECGESFLSFLSEKNHFFVVWREGAG